MSNDPTIFEPAESGLTPNDESQSGMIRNEPDTSNARKLLVGKWQETIRKAKSHWKDDFDRMDEDIAFLSGDQWDTINPGPKRRRDELTVINIVQRHIQQRVAALYAKNPKAVARRRKTMDFSHWDGTMNQLNAIQEQIANTVQANQQIQLQNQAILSGQPVPPGTTLMEEQPISPEILSTLKDIQDGTQKRIILNKVAETLEIIFNYTILQQIPPFKAQMKQLVRRVAAVGIGWLKIGYQRSMEPRPEDVNTVSGITERMATLKRLMADAIDEKITENQAEYEELELQLKGLQEGRQQVTREGLVFDFPLPKAIIPDPLTRQLSSLTGARWVAEEYILSNDDVKEIYGVDLTGTAAMEYTPANAESSFKSFITEGNEGKQKKGICVWEVWNKSTGEVFVIADGYSEFLREPREPVIRLKRFFPYFGLAFNTLESSDPCYTGADRVSIYPISDVSLLRPMQKEYNRQREGLRRHRRANAPKIAVGGTLEESDIELLKNSSSLDTTVIKLQALAPGQKVSELIQPIQMAPIDPALYDTEMQRSDILLVVGQSDASVGAASASTTATGDSIAEQSRTISLASQVDDLDDMLTDVARAAGELLLNEMSPEKAKEIAGAGAAWPDLSSQEIADEIYLEIEAGSSGRPNKAAESANFQRLAPLLLQIPGINPEWMAKEAIRRLDDRIDTTDAIISGMPSLLTMAQIQLQQAMPGFPQGAEPAMPQLAGPEGQLPSQQGAQGANNQQMPPGISGVQGGNEDALGGFNQP